ncbi:MAG: hypothetical protein QE495_02615 [Acidovorax sp.]|uniref:hypothetical protein n=1 Tax=Acidovorax sp. TaxID=1872122 RepID=UPI0026033BEA|nr:hypothetical protein [Acidovorax sp.]MDH4425320.1 hypothetical protein [Acidovorax sp.]
MILIKTEQGNKAFKERSPLFSARQRAAFLLFDGQKNAEHVLLATAGMGVTLGDLDYMVEQGFLLPQATGTSTSTSASTANADTSSRTGEAAKAASARTPQERYSDAKPLATQLTASLGLRGFRLNLAVEAAAGYEDLLDLLPKIQDALGTKACRELEWALKG